jgi:GcrA cell cycle regulator
MSRWTDEELRQLITLWPTSTAAQIAYRLHRPRAAVCGKAKRLLQNAKHPNPRKRRRRARPPQIRIMLPPPPVNDGLAMRPCSLIELDDGRCHWPLGDVNEITTEFCGDATVPGRRYCAHHLRMARYSFL